MFLCLYAPGQSIAKVLGKTFAMALLCHLSEFGCFQVSSLFCLQELLLCFTFSIVQSRNASGQQHAC